jgi:alpha-L-fucosidase
MILVTSLQVVQLSAEVIHMDREVLRQVVELLSSYSPDILWFDGGPAVMSIEDIRKLQPSVVVNPRMHGHGDFTTPECHMPEETPQGWWELCEIWHECGWGYEKNGGERYKSLEWMLGRLRDVRRRGGNYLINVGPRADGTLPDAYYERMKKLAAAGGYARSGTVKEFVANNEYKNQAAR